MKTLFFLLLFPFIVQAQFGTGSTRNNIIATANYEDNGTVNAQFNGVEKCAFSWAQMVSDTITRYTRKSARFEYRAGDSCSAGHRTEVADTVSHEKERWYGMSTYFATGFNVPTFDGCVFVQWHEFPDAGELFRSPPLSLDIKQGRFEIYIRSDTNAINSSASSFSYDGVTIAAGTRYKHNDHYDLGPVTQGVWYDWVFHFILDYTETNTGLTEVWQNGVKIFSLKGPNVFNDQVYPYFKYGMYEPDITTVNTPFSQRVIWDANIRMAHGAATYDDVAPTPKPNAIVSPKINVTVR